MVACIQTTRRMGGPEDEGRRFIITYFKADRTVVVREPPKRNSGIIGGNFLSRMKVCTYVHTTCSIHRVHQLLRFVVSDKKHTHFF